MPCPSHPCPSPDTLEAAKALAPPNKALPRPGLQHCHRAPPSAPVQPVLSPSLPAGNYYFLPREAVTIQLAPMLGAYSPQWWTDFFVSGWACLMATCVGGSPPRSAVGCGGGGAAAAAATAVTARTAVRAHTHSNAHTHVFRPTHPPTPPPC